ncbi:zinc/cadmium resistance protein-like protein [Cryomyces antarcticus]
MGLSKSSRIIILLAIDSAFFLLELIVGSAVHSLALVADSFHMLNDVLSLCVGLWAVKVAHEKTNSKMYTYGWQRAETLGALINGVFLVALCLSIFLEAIQRFVEPVEVSHPMLVLIVGCFGLASNIIGLFLFHDHGHSHGGGGHGHSHGASDELGAAEEGEGNAWEDEADRQAADESGNIADVLPESRIGNWPTTQQNKKSVEFVQSDEDSGTAVENGTSPLSPVKSATGSRRAKRRSSRSRSRGLSSFNDIYVNPAEFRKSIIEAGRLQEIDPGTDTENEESAVADEDRIPTPGTPLLSKSGPNSPDDRRMSTPKKTKPIDHKSHNHAKPKDAGKGGHSHSDLNMRGVFLHVMGDALGNIGVIASALIIWLTKYSWRFYSDPLISLIITVIILASAIPLCKAASRILLQAVPAGISVDEIKEDIEDMPGIVSAHHLHVWQLSDTKLVASLHVQVAFDFEGSGSARYMQLARAIRKCLHEYGIHSSTIQPEFCLDKDHDHSVPVSVPEHAHSNSSNHSHDDHDHDRADGDQQDSHANGTTAQRTKTASKQTSKAASLKDSAADDVCLLECGDECGGGKSCCAPLQKDDGGRKDGEDHRHGHGPGGHSHSH